MNVQEYLKLFPIDNEFIMIVNEHIMYSGGIYRFIYKEELKYYEVLDAYKKQNKYVIKAMKIKHKKVHW